MVLESKDKVTSLTLESPLIATEATSIPLLWQPGTDIIRPTDTVSTQLTYIALPNGRYLRLSYGAMSCQGRTVRRGGKANQDSWVIAPSLGGNDQSFLMGVFDGHGPKGEDASHYCAVHLSSLIQAQPDFEQNVFRALRSSFEPLHEGYIRAAAAAHKSGLHADPSVSGTTAITVLLHGNKFACANVGDSRAVMFSETIPLTRLFPASPRSPSSMSPAPSTPATPSTRRKLFGKGGFFSPKKKTEEEAGSEGNVEASTPVSPGKGGFPNEQAGFSPSKDSKEVINATNVELETKDETEKEKMQESAAPELEAGEPETKEPSGSVSTPATPVRSSRVSSTSAPSTPAPSQGAEAKPDLATAVAASEMDNEPQQWVPIPLSRDHKPTRSDERKRVENSQAVVLSERDLGLADGDASKLYICRAVNGVTQYGVLFTRSLGDADAHAHLGLTATPEVVEGALTEQVRAIVLASDGIWDVCSETTVADILQTTPRKPLHTAAHAIAGAKSDSGADVDEEVGSSEKSLPDAQLAVETLVKRASEAWNADSPGRRDDITAIILFCDFIDAEVAEAEMKAFAPRA